MAGSYYGTLDFGEDLYSYRLGVTYSLETTVNIQFDVHSSLTRSMPLSTVVRIQIDWDSDPFIGYPWGPWLPTDIDGNWTPVFPVGDWTPIEVTSEWTPVHTAGNWTPVDTISNWTPIGPDKRPNYG